MMYKKLLQTTVLTFILLLGTGVTIVLAGDSVGPPTYSSVAGISTTSQKGIDYGENNWLPWVKSTAAQAVDKIGFTYWTTYVECPDGDILAHHLIENTDDSDGVWERFNTTSYNTTGMTDYDDGICDNGSGTYWNVGNHMYVEGYQQDYPYAWDTLP